MSLSMSYESRAEIVVTRRGLTLELGPHQWRAIGDAFARDHHVFLRGFLGDDVLSIFRTRLARGAFRNRIEDGREIERTLDDPAVVAMYLVALNDPAVFTAVTRVTGCGPIGCFSGRVHLRGPREDGGHYYPWHSDATDHRLIGLTVNLGDKPYEGGVLEIRRRDTEVVIARASNPTPGDAVIFRISSELEHHVTPVTAGGPRVVLAGWFRREPDFWREALAMPQPVDGTTGRPSTAFR
jgi:hypothetical protein